MVSKGRSNTGLIKYLKIVSMLSLKQTLHYIILCFTLSKTVPDSCTLRISNIFEV